MSLEQTVPKMNCELKCYSWSLIKWHTVRVFSILGHLNAFTVTLTATVYTGSEQLLSSLTDIDKATERILFYQTQTKYAPQNKICHLSRSSETYICQSKAAYSSLLHLLTKVCSTVLYVTWKIIKLFNQHSLIRFQRFFLPLYCGKTVETTGRYFASPSSLFSRLID